MSLDRPHTTLWVVAVLLWAVPSGAQPTPMLGAEAPPGWLVTPSVAVAGLWDDNVTLAGSSGPAREGTYVPAAAIQRDGEESIAFVPISDTEFQLREVEIGNRSGDWVEVTKGLAVGERIVTTGSFLLKSEARRESFGGHEH